MHAPSAQVLQCVGSTDPKSILSCHASIAVMKRMAVLCTSCHWRAGPFWSPTPRTKRTLLRRTSTARHQRVTLLQPLQRRRGGNKAETSQLERAGSVPGEKRTAGRPQHGHARHTRRHKPGTARKAPAPPCGGLGAGPGPARAGAAQRGRLTSGRGRPGAAAAAAGIVVKY